MKTRPQLCQKDSQLSARESPALPHCEVAEGKERAAWSGKFDAVKSEVEQVEGEVRGVVTRAGQIATDAELAERVRGCILLEMIHRYSYTC